MRRIRAIALMMALVLVLLGTQATSANAAVTGGHAKGSAENATYGELAFHASGYLLKGTGGFERYTTAPGGYFSGKVECYVQEDVTRGTFVARITKADDRTLINKYVIVWLAPDAFSFRIVQTYTCDNTNDSLITPGLPPEGIQSGYITLRP